MPISFIYWCWKPIAIVVDKEETTRKLYSMLAGMGASWDFYRRKEINNKGRETHYDQSDVRVSFAIKEDFR